MFFGYDSELTFCLQNYSYEFQLSREKLIVKEIFKFSKFKVIHNVKKKNAQENPT